MAATTTKTPTIPSSMRASQWTTTKGGLDKNLKINPSAPLPKTATSLAPDQTLVRVAYTTPNPVDYKLAEHVPFIFSKPATPCLDFSGTVVNTTLPHLKAGDLVFGKTEPPAFGGLGEYVVVGKEGVVPLPKGVSLKEAATVGVVGLTAFQTLVPYLKGGEKVLINGGSGGVGTYAIQIAKAIGCEVTTTCSGANVELCKSLGADEVIDYRTTDLIPHLKRNGKQFDLVVDNVFSDGQLYLNAHHYLKPRAKFVTIAGTPSFSFLLTVIWVMTWPSWLGGAQRPFQFVTVQAKAAEYQQIGNWMAEGKVKAVIEKEFEFEQAGEAFAHLKTGRTRGKLVIKVGGES